MASRLRVLLRISLIALASPAVMGQGQGQGLADQEVAVSADSPTAHGAWRYRRLRNDTPVLCRADEETKCITHLLRVENESGDTLECTSRLTYDGINNENRFSMTARTVIRAKESRNVMSDRAKADVPVVDATVACTARAPRPRLNIPKECAFQVLEALPLEDFYPPAARRVAEEGPVELSFTLTKAQGRASDVKVEGSSLSQRLDEAAVKYVTSMKFGTACPSTRYELRVLFKLDE